MTTANDADVVPGSAEPVVDRYRLGGIAGDQPSGRVSFDANDRGDDTRRVDDVAGGEFVDDRIRLRE